MPKQLNISLAMTADTSQAKKQLQDLQNQLSNLIKTTASSNNGSLGLTKDIQEATKEVAKLQVQLKNATDINTGKLDLSKFNQSLKQSGTSITSYQKSLQQLGPSGERAFQTLAMSIAQADMRIKGANSKLNEFATSLANTARWQISSSVLHGFIGALNTAFGYAKNLNESLTNIRIVTGQTADQMADFAERANKAAQSLSTTTTAYTDAALIFYQQGLGDADVEARTNAVIKMAQVTGDSAKEVSSYMTAIWNNFDNGSKSLEYYEDVIAKLGATTASSSAEISEGISKFASVAQTAGLSYEYATSALATVVAATRQSADTVGTAFKTLFARIQDLELGKTLDDGTTLGKYSEALDKIGVSIKDATGGMRSMDDILDDMGNKWKNLSQDTQIAVAQAVAGTRQYTQLVALMENWDQMKVNVNTAQNSEGAVQEQADIYAESWEAAQKRVKAASEDIYKSLIDDKFFIQMNNALANVLKTIKEVINNLGGVQGVISVLGTVFFNVFQNKIASSIDNTLTNLKLLTTKGRKEIEDLRTEALNGALRQNVDSSNPADQARADAMRSNITLQQELLANANSMSEFQRSVAASLIDQNKALGDNVVKTQQELELLEKETETAREKLEIELMAKREREADKARAQVTTKAVSQAEAINTQYNEGKIDEASRDAELKKLKDAADKQLADIDESLKTTEKNLQDFIDKITHFGEIRLNTKDLSNQLNGILTVEDKEKTVKNAEEIISTFTKAGTDIKKEFGDEGANAINKLNNALKDSSTDMETKCKAVAAAITELTDASIDAKTSQQGLIVTTGKADGETQAYFQQYEAIMNVLQKKRDLVKTNEALGESEKSSSKYIQDSSNVMLTAGQRLATVAQGLSSFSMALNAVNGSINTLTNSKSTGLQKLIAVITLFSTTVSAVTKITEVATRLANSSRLAKTKETAVIVANTAALRANTAEKIKNNNATSASSKELSSSLNSVGIKAGIAAAAILVLVGVTSALQTKQKEAAEAEKERADQSIKASENIKKELDANTDLYNSYKAALDTYKETGDNKSELTQKALEAANAFGIEGAAVALLTDDYDNLTESLRLANIENDKKKIQELKNQNTYNANKAAGITHEQSAENTWIDGVVSNLTDGLAVIGMNIAGLLPGVNSDDLMMSYYGDRIPAEMNADKLNYVHLDEKGKAVIDLGNSAQENIARYEEIRATGDAVLLNGLKDFEEIYTKAKENLEAIVTLQAGVDAEENIVGKVKTLEEYEQQREKILLNALGDIDKNSEQGKKVVDAVSKVLAATEEGMKYEAIAVAHMDNGILTKEWKDFYSELEKTGEQFSTEGFFKVATLFPDASLEEIRGIWNRYKTLFETAADIDKIVLQKDQIDLGLNDLSEKMTDKKWETFFKDTSDLPWGENGMVSQEIFKSWSLDAQKNYLETLKKTLGSASDEYTKFITKTKADIEGLYNDANNAFLEGNFDKMQQLLFAADAQEKTLDTITQNRLQTVAKEYEKAKKTVDDYINTLRTAKIGDTFSVEIVNYLEEIGVQNLEEYLITMGDGTARLAVAAEDFVREVNDARFNTREKEIDNTKREINSGYAQIDSLKKDLQIAKGNDDKKATYQEEIANDMPDILRIIGKVDKAMGNLESSNNEYEKASAEVDKDYSRLTHDVTAFDVAEMVIANLAGYDFGIGKREEASEKKQNAHNDVKAFIKDATPTAYTFWNTLDTKEKYDYLKRSGYDEIQNLKYETPSNIDINELKNTETEQQVQGKINQVYENIKAQLQSIGGVITTDYNEDEEAFKIETDALIQALEHKNLQDRANAATSFEELDQFLSQGNIDSKGNNDRADEYWAAWNNMNSKMEMENVDSEELERYAKILGETADKSDLVSDSLKNNSSAAREIAREVIKMNQGISSLSSNFEEWNSILQKSDKSSQEYADALDGLKSSASDLLDINKDFLSDEFLTDSKNLKDFELAASGDAEAIDRLRDSAAQDIILQISAGNDDIKRELMGLYDLVNEEMPNLEIGMTLTGTDTILQQFNQLAASGKYTQTQLEALADSMRLDVKYKTETVKTPVMKTVTMTEHDTTDVEWGDDGKGNTFMKHYITTEKSTSTTDKVGENSQSVVAMSADGEDPIIQYEESQRVVGVESATVKASGAMNNGSSSNSGSKGSAAKNKKGVKNDASQKKDNSEIDRYHEITKVIEDLDRKISDLDKTKSRAFGKDKIAAIRQETAALKTQASAYRERLREAKEYLKQDQGKVTSIGAQLDSQGRISNYTQLMEGLNAQYNAAYDQYVNAQNAAVAAYNASAKGDADNEIYDKAKEAADEAWKARQDAYKDKVDAIKQYEDTVKQIAEDEAKLKEALLQAYDNEFEEITISVDLNVTIEDRKIKLIKDLLEDVGDSAERAIDRIALLSKQMNSEVNKSNTATQGINDILGNALSKGSASAEDRKAAGWEDVPILSKEAQNGILSRFMTGTQTADDMNIISKLGLTQSEIDKLMEFSDNLLAVNENLRSLRQEILGQSLNAFNEFNNKIENQSSHLQSLSKQLETYKSIIDTVGKNFLDPNGTLGKRANALQSDIAKKNAAIAKQQVDEIDKMIAGQEELLSKATSKEAIDQLQAGLDEMMQKRDAAQENWLSSWEEAFVAIGNEFDANLTDIVNNFGKAVAGAAGSLENLQESYSMKQNVASDYLADYEKIYNLSKLTRDINKSINDSNDIKNNQRLAALQKEITASMESGEKISEYTAENYRRQYELMLAQQQLEDAKNNKTNLTLMRDSQGNYSYQYSADEDSIADAQQNYENKLYEIQKANDEYQQEMQENMINLEKWYADYIANLDKTDAHYEEKLAEATKYYYEQLEFYNREYSIVLSNNRSLYENEWKNYSDMTGYKRSADKDYVDTFGESVLSITTGFSTLDEYMNANKEATAQMVIEANKEYEKYKTDIENTCNVGGTSLNNFANDAHLAFNNISVDAEKTTQDIDKMVQKFDEDYNNIIAKSKIFVEQYDSVIDKAILENQNMYKSINDIIKAYNDLSNLPEAKIPEIVCRFRNVIITEYQNIGAPSSNPTSSNGDSIDSPVDKQKLPIESGSYSLYTRKKNTYEDPETLIKQWTNKDAMLGEIAKNKAIFGNTRYANGFIAINEEGKKIVIPYGVDNADTLKILLGKSWSSFDTGGYTGNWNSSEGRIAMLHQKELILNATDTENMLEMVDKIRELEISNTLERLSALHEYTQQYLNIAKNGNGEIAQNIVINADFPAVSNAEEIKQAFNNLINSATQRAAKFRK